VLIEDCGREAVNGKIWVSHCNFFLFLQTDQLFIAISKIQTAPFTYLFLRYAYYEPNVLWSVQDITLKTTLLPLPILYLVFDFFYTVLHWVLHIKVVYGYIHKHHHHQKAPR
jgi:sterol desaturase/sphingolipid hydroxylase (fatty acid hydroxylase superfamily)